jgi:hypothetical protein
MPTIPRPITPRERYFYRYQSALLDRLKPVILEHKLYMPLASQLNDPADGRPKLAPMSAEQLLRFLYAPASNPTYTLAAQQRIVATLVANIRIHGREALQRKMSEMLNEHVEQYRVFSMSKRFDNPGLWAYYAGNHSGYCLEFANEGPFFEKAVEVIYGDAIPMDVNDPEQRKSYFFYCKRSGWSHEEEVRVIAMPGAPGFVEIDPRFLTRIILGRTMTSQDRQQVRGWAKQRQPRLTVVQAEFDSLTQGLRLISDPA